jgi:hypothetical protein
VTFLVIPPDTDKLVLSMLRRRSDLETAVSVAITERELAQAQLFNAVLADLVNIYPAQNWPSPFDVEALRKQRQDVIVRLRIEG